MSQINPETMLKVLAANPELIEPYGNYVVGRVVPLEELQQTKAGIFIPETAREKRDQIFVRALAVGKGQISMADGSFIPCLTKPGDLIMVLKNRPYEIKLGGASLVVVFEGDIIGRINEAALAALAEEIEALEVEAPTAPTVEVQTPATLPSGQVVETENARARVAQLPGSGLFVVSTERK